MIRTMGLAGLGDCNAVPVVPEFQAVTVPMLATAAVVPMAGPATAGPATLATPKPPGFDYTATGVVYQGQQVVSWAQLALGLLALRGSG